MSDREPLLRAVIGSPDDDTPRLVYADWLDENGEPDYAEYIRTAVAVARTGHDDCPDKRVHRPSPRSVERLIRCGGCPFCVGMRRLNELQPHIGTTLGFGYAHSPEHPDGFLPSEFATLFFRRGFAWRVDLPPAAFTAEYVTPLFAAHPVQEVKIIGKRPEHIDRGRNGVDTSGWTWFIGDANWFDGPHHVTNAIWRHMGATWHGSEADANAAMSRACVSWARTVADRAAGHVAAGG